MFGDNKAKKEAINNDFSANTFRAGATIKGDVTCEGNIRIDGKLDGTLVSKGKLVIGESGLITGNIKCADANVEGRIEGVIEVDNLLILKSKSFIKGDIFTNKFVVEEGAKFNGKVVMGSKSSLRKVEDINEQIERKASV